MNPNLNVKLLTKSDIQSVIDLSIKIFEPENLENNPYHKYQTWMEHFTQGGILLGYFESEELIGFTFNYDRVPEQKISHLWLSGVDENYRRHGIYKTLMNELVKLLKKKGYLAMTVNTNREKFPAMLNYLLKNQYSIQKEELLEDKTHKVYLKRQL